MTKQKANSIVHATRLLACLAFSFSANFAQATTAICEPGYYSLTENGSDCQVCPPGTYSEVRGAAFCTPCLDTIYRGEGANAAELWNGDLFCSHLGSIDDDILNSSSGDVPGAAAFATPSISPSSFISESNDPFSPTDIFLSTQEVHSANMTQDELDSLISPNDKGLGANYFEVHGRLHQCPTTHEMIVYPIVVAIFLIMLIVFLEFILPVSFITYAWLGVEYLQMLYLIGISSGSWSPAAGLLFGKLIPVFAIDFNASFSLKCIMGDNMTQIEAADQLLILSLPMIFFTLLTFLAKISKNRILVEETASRWTTVLVYLGYLKLVLSSLEALKFPQSLSAEPLSEWTNSNSFYSTLGGITGLIIYGLIFPIWFLQGIYRRNLLNLALAEDRDENGEGDNEDSKRKKYVQRKNQIFMTLGILPIGFRQAVWWWPGVWLLRKLALSIMWYCFPEEQNLFLDLFLWINFMILIAQYHKQPLGEEEKNFYSMATVDAMLQSFLAAMVPIAFALSWSQKTDVNSHSMARQRVEDAFVLFIFTASFLYLVATIVMRCMRPEPRFRYLISQVVITETKKNNNGNHTSETPNDDAFVKEPIDDNLMLPTLSVEDSNSCDKKKEIEFFAAGKDNAWASQGIDSIPTDEEYGFTASHSSPYLVAQGDEEGCDRERYSEHFSSSTSQPKFVRSDSTIGTCDDDGGIEDDTQTLYEEVWVDEETGEEIIDPEQGNWMDAETGLPVVHNDNN